MQKHQILLVEDDELIRTAIRDALRATYTIHEASDLKDVLAHELEFIDLAIIDYLLPDGNGFDVLEQIRDRQPTLPAIIMTAYSTEDVVIQALRKGATDYMRKPLSLWQLRERVGAILSGRQDYVHSEEFVRRTDLLLESIAIYLEKNYRDKAITLDGVAAMANMSRSSFCRAFREKFGQTFISYLNAARIRNAADLLKSDLKLIDIAFHVGFGSVEHFNRTFKKTYGVPPREYRKQYKGIGSTA